MKCIFDKCLKIVYSKMQESTHISNLIKTVLFYTEWVTSCWDHVNRWIQLIFFICNSICCITRTHFNNSSNFLHTVLLTNFKHQQPSSKFHNKCTTMTKILHTNLKSSHSFIRLAKLVTKQTHFGTHKSMIITTNNW